jgi:dihydropteroate synthase
VARQTRNALEGLWHPRPPFSIPLPCGKRLDTAPRALVMGILNVTPDSFSDGGLFFSPDAAVKHALELVAQGADILDVGGESTRPGSEPVTAEEEKRRVVPVIEALAAETDVPVSIDTQKAEVAEAALKAGAQMINDVSALRTDAEMAPLAAERGTPVCLMHMLGTPRTMQQNPTYREVVSDVLEWLKERVAFAVESGIGRERLLVDPGFGFGKTPQHNLELVRRLHEFHALGCALLIGPSRKSTLGVVLNASSGERLYGTVAMVACAVMAGCHVVRVHDVKPALDVVRTCEAVRRGITWEPQQ